MIGTNDFRSRDVELSRCEAIALGVAADDPEPDVRHCYDYVRELLAKHS